MTVVASEDQIYLLSEEQHVLRKVMVMNLKTGNLLPE
jgi:hypothetical protein